MRLSPLGTSATNWPIVPAPDGSWWVWSSRWNENWQGKPKYSEKTCPSATFSTTNPTWPDLGSNPGRSGGKPATARLSYGTALRTEQTVHRKSVLRHVNVTIQWHIPWKWQLMKLEHLLSVTFKLAYPGDWWSLRSMPWRLPGRVQCESDDCLCPHLQGFTWQTQLSLTTSTMVTFYLI
jgi:hypothetical protein